MKVEVAAGFKDRQVLICLEVQEHATAWEAIMAAQLSTHLPGLTPDPTRIGIFGRLCAPDSRLKEGDRVEVYRPLSADPKEIRRELAKIERAKRNSVV